MSKYKVGDKVLLEGKIVEVDKLSNQACDLYRVKFEGGVQGTWITDEYVLISKTYEDGLNEAWELARKVALYDCDIEGGYSVAELKAIFNRTTLQDVFRSYTIKQALAKIEAYEKSQQIQVGDVIEYEGDDIQGVVIDIISDEECYIYNENGCIEKNVFSVLRKTGRHIDITSILEQIRSDS